MTTPSRADQITLILARLTELEIVGGRPLADRLLCGFAQTVAGLRRSPRRESEWPQFAHRTAGIAGMLGFGDMAHVFASFDDPQEPAPSFLRVGQILDEAEELVEAVKTRRGTRCD